MKSGRNPKFWSQETIRRRGVRALVDCLRLRKEYRQLSSECADHIAENWELRVLLEHTLCKLKIGVLNSPVAKTLPLGATVHRKIFNTSKRELWRS
jgi:hypothetical protein